jgi:hypothetical protein
MRTLLRILPLRDVSVAALNDQFVNCIPIAALRKFERSAGGQRSRALPNVSYLLSYLLRSGLESDDLHDPDS